MGQAQINVRTRACSRTSIARTKQAALTHNVRGKELKLKFRKYPSNRYTPITLYPTLPFYNIIIIFDTVVTQKRNIEHEKQ